MDIQTKDGIILRGIPEGTPDAEIKARIEKIRGGELAPVAAAQPERSFLGKTVGDLSAGVVRGAGSIGATILAPYDIAKDAFAGRGLSLESNLERRKAMDAGLQTMGADPESAMYGVGKFGGEVAGTLGAGGVLASGAKVLGAVPKIASALPAGAVQKVVEALRTWGMSTGAAPVGIAQRAADLGVRAGAGAATGGAAGALIDPEHAPLSAGMGAGAAVVLPTVFGGAANLARRAKSAFYPTSGELGVRAAGDKTAEVIAALQSQRSGVPGVNLTAGQASVPANSAEFAALQKLTAERHAPSLYFGPKGVKGEQEAARLAAVRGIGGTPNDLAAAINARTAASNVNYEAAFNIAIKSDKNLVELSKNPFFKDELKDAYKLVEASNAKRVSEGLPPRKSLTEFLQFVKEGLDAKIQQATNPNAPAISNAAKNAALDSKKKLVAWLGENNPAYETARLSHIDASKTINQMKAGQDIERALLEPGTGKERSASFSGAVRAGETKISKSSGRPQIEDLTPAQRKVIDAINEDFARNAQYGELATKGMASVKELVGVPQAPPTGVFMPLLSAARSWLNKALGAGHEAALDRLAPVMRDPQQMATLMQAATPQQRAVMNAMIEKLISSGSIVGTAQQQGGAQ